MTDTEYRGFATGETAAWTRRAAEGIERTSETMAPIVYPPATDPTPADRHVWDAWILRDRDGSIAQVDGFRVLLSLTAPADLLPGKRHDVAEIRCLYSRDGRRWRDGGPVFENALGSRQWAGSALLDDGRVYVLYTAAGRRDEPDLTYGQRIVAATGGSVETDGDDLSIVGPWDHRVPFEPDGEWYEREEQSRGMIYTFRDPWFFEDSASDETYLLFEANTPVPEGSDACGGDARAQEFNGSVGIARSPTGDPTDWELLPPVLDAVCVNQELERPHVIVRDGRYYLFVSSHAHTFAPGLEGFDGLYGFVADDLRGAYRPLNGSGLVVTNPANAPFQAYSWLAFPHREEALVTSFFNYFDYDRPLMDDVALLPEGEQRRRFGGTLAPTIRLTLDGDRTRILGTLEHGRIPTEDEELPPTFAERERGERSERRRGYRYGDPDEGE